MPAKGVRTRPACHPDRMMGGDGLCGSCYHTKWLREKKAKNPAFASALRESEAADARERRARDRLYARRTRLNRYGLTIADEDAMLERQWHRCPICEEKLEVGAAEKMRTPHIDHDHTTGKVRALLCGMCNLILGHSKENQRVLMRAVGYLNEWSDRSGWPKRPTLRPL